MTRPNLSKYPAHLLVDRFVTLATAQHQAVLLVQNAKFTHLFWLMKDVLDALEARAGDQRRLLLPLLVSQNLWVRYRAGQALLALAPECARRAIESVRDSHIQPEAAEAASTLTALDTGVLVPT